MPEEKPVERRYIFNGSAVAFGGRIRRPDNIFLKSAAVAHLPVTGGLSEANISGPDASQYHYKEYLKFSEGHSRTLGDFTDPQKAVEYTHHNHDLNTLPVSTTVESRLLDLCIDAEAEPARNTPRRIFQAKKFELHMQTISSQTLQQSTIRSLSVAFEGITLATGNSAPVELKVLTAPDIFCHNDTKAKLMEKFGTDGNFRKQYANCFHPLGDGEKGLLSSLVGRHDIPYADRGPIVATVVTGLEWAGGVPPEGTEILNNRLTISGLGRIFFGEIIIDDHYQRVTTIRFELGCKVGGSGNGPEASSNGTWFPPRF